MSETSPVWISSAFWWSCHWRVICGSSQLPSNAATTVTSSGFESHGPIWLLQATRLLASRVPACCVAASSGGWSAAAASVASPLDSHIQGACHGKTPPPSLPCARRRMPCARRRAGRHRLCRDGPAREQRRDETAQERRRRRREGEAALARRPEFHGRSAARGSGRSQGRRRSRGPGRTGRQGRDEAVRNREEEGRPRRHRARSVERRLRTAEEGARRRHLQPHVRPGRLELRSARDPGRQGHRRRRGLGEDRRRQQGRRPDVRPRRQRLDRSGYLHRRALLLMTDDDRVRLDYDKTTELLRTLLDIRFKLLALVPTISGLAVGFVGRGAKPAELLAVGLLGLVATLGVFFYQVRNSQLYEYALRRAAVLETRLGVGLFTERPGLSVRPFGIAAAGHHRGI